jgi:hypothetical protein
MPVVYKITRTDGLEYVGITVNAKRRFVQHAKSKRFEMGIEKTVILWEGESYEEAEDLEEYYIDLFNTYINGLNVTPTGKGLNGHCKFNTLGYVYTDASRAKMSEKAKGRIPWNKGRPHSNETRELFRAQRKGKPAKNKKITDEQVSDMLTAYNNDRIAFTVDFIRSCVKKADRNKVYEGIDYTTLTTPNGKPLNKHTLYAKFFAIQFNISTSLLREYITGARTRCK